MFLHTEIKQPFSLPAIHTKNSTHKKLPSTSFLCGCELLWGSQLPADPTEHLPLLSVRIWLHPFLIAGRELTEQSWRCIVGDRTKSNYMKTFPRFWFTS